MTLDPPIAHADGPNDWPMFHHDLAHTGYNPDETQLKPPLRLKWSYTTGRFIESYPAVANGVVYVGSYDGKVYALDAATGALRWSYTTGGAVPSSPAVANGVVYVGSYEPKVYALDAATGALRWSYTTGGMVDSSPTVANGVVYVGSWDNKLYALNAASGALGWSYTTGGLVWSSPAVANGVVYVGSYDSKVYAFEGQPPPVSVSAASYVALASFPISWTVPSTWTGTSASSYDVQYRDGASGAWTDLLTSTTSTSTTFSGQEGHTYSFRARSRTGTGSLGDWSEPVSTTVDLTAPTGSIAAQGWSSPYISNTVTLSVSASDSTSGLSQMQLGSDGLTFGAWETYTTTRSHVAPPGAAAVYGRFKDGAGNISQPVTGSITLDASPPAGSVQAQGWSSPYISNTVTLSVSASDGTSGLSQMQFGPNSETFNPWESYGTASLYLAPPGATAVFGRFKDRAQNVSSPVSASLTLLDDVSPTGTISINAGAAYANSVTATLSLSATDNLSGVSAMAFSNDGSAWSDWPGFSTSNSWPLAPAPDGLRTVYARFKDAAQNVSLVYSDTIILDTLAPTGTVTINGGASDTNSTAVTLALSAADGLSGLAQMSFSNDGQSYSPWEEYATTRSWNIPGGNGTKTVYARFLDNAGNVSQPISDTIVLNTTEPSSAVNPLALFQASPAFTVTWSGTSGGSGPDGYDVQYKDGAAGQWTGWVTSTLATSAVFTATEGHTYYFQSRLRDQASNTEPFPGGDGDTHTTVDLTAPTGTLSINGGALDSTAVTMTLVLASADSLSGVAQSSYSNDGASWTGWETYATARTWTAPSGDGEKTVWARFKDTAGNVSDAVSDTIRMDTSVSPAYGFYINDDALFTSQVTVTLSLPALPNTAQMMVSNGGGFFGAKWESYSAYMPWAITQYGSYVIPRTVYVKYKDVNGNVSATYQDDIILDLNAPTGSVSIEGSAPVTTTAHVAATAGTLRLSASDDVSGVGGMMVSNSPAFSGAAWEALSASKSWSLGTGGRVYVAFKDNAGNASPTYAAALSGAKESLPPVVLGMVHPKTGGTIASSETNTTIAFPAGAVDGKTEVIFVPAVEPSLEASTGTLKSTGKFMTLTAKAGETDVTAVSKPYVMTASYAGADIAGIDENSLGIYWWNGSAWVKEAGSQVDKATKTVSAAINHLSSFAVLGESTIKKVYLPLAVKSAGGW